MDDRTRFLQNEYQALEDLSALSAGLLQVQQIRQQVQQLKDLLGAVEDKSKQQREKRKRRGAMVIPIDTAGQPTPAIHSWNIRNRNRLAAETAERGW